MYFLSETYVAHAIETRIITACNYRATRTVKSWRGGWQRQALASKNATATVKRHIGRGEFKKKREPMKKLGTADEPGEEHVSSFAECV